MFDFITDTERNEKAFKNNDLNLDGRDTLNIRPIIGVHTYAVSIKHLDAETEKRLDYTITVEFLETNDKLEYLFRIDKSNFFIKT